MPWIFNSPVKTHLMSLAGANEMGRKQEKKKRNSGACTKKSVSVLDSMPIFFPAFFITDVFLAQQMYSAL